MDNHVVLFDGVCNLCNGLVNFLIDHDRHNKLKFASLQSAFGQKILAEHHLPTQNFDTFIFLSDGKVYMRSSGILELFRVLGGWWQLCYMGIVLPSFVRDSLYAWVAKNRYKWFGKQESCRMPTPELKAKFLS